MIKNCTAQEAAKAVSAGKAACIVDVREPSEFLAAHVPGSQLVPLSVLDAQLCCLQRGRPVYLLCAGGVRAAEAARPVFPSG